MDRRDYSRYLLCVSLACLFLLVNPAAAIIIDVGTIPTVTNKDTTVNIDINFTDADGLTPTFGCNRTDLFTDFNTSDGTGSWIAEAGSYTIEFTVDDGNGSSDSYINELYVTSFNGSGIDPDPYQITTMEQLSDIRYYKTGDFILMNDLDASVTRTWNDGAGWIALFRDAGQTNGYHGHIDGNYHVIDGLYMNRPGEQGISFITFLGSGAEITRLGLTNISYTVSRNSGGLAYYDYHGSSINECFVTGQIIGSAGIGGMFGYSYYGGDIVNCWTNVSLTATSYCGGLIGFCGSNIQNSYSYGIVPEGSYTGAFIGRRNLGTLSNNYWNIDIRETSASSSGTGLTTEELKQYSSFTSWDFDTVWGITPDLNNRYPVLRGFYDSSDVMDGNIPETQTGIIDVYNVTHNFDFASEDVVSDSLFIFDDEIGEVLNGTIISYIETVEPHETSDIMIFAYDIDTGLFSYGNTSSLIVENQPISFVNVIDYSCNKTQTVNLVLEYSDDDGDDATFSCNRTDLFTDFDTSSGEGNWTTTVDNVGTYSILVTVDDGYGSTDSAIFNITVNDAEIPDAPLNLQNSSDNFYVNWSWDSANGADSYNVCLNDVWFNGLTDTYINDTSVDAHGTSTIKVYSYNETYDIMSVTEVNDSVTVDNNLVLITNLNNIVVYEGGLVEIDANSIDLDNDEINFTCNRTDLFSDFDTETGEGSWQTGTSDAGSYNVTIYADDGYGSNVSQMFTITVNKYSLSTPELSNETGNFFVNWAWDVVDNADCYNVSLNGVWINDTTVTEINNTDVGPHNTSNIQVLAYNVTSASLSEMATDSVTFTNNPVILTDLNDISVYESDLVEIDADFTDLDDDEVIFSCNRTDLFSDFDTETGEGSWQTDSSDAGTYAVTIYADDSYGSNVSQIITVTVNEYAIGGDEDLSYISGNFFVNWTWQDVPGADYYNVSENDVWVYNGTNTSYDSADMLPHTWSNITIYGYNVTSDVLTELVSNETQLQNNPIAISNLNDISIFYGNNVTIDANFIDVDGDAGTFACNRTDLFEDFNTSDGTGTWATNSTMIGTYSVAFNVTDGYGSISEKIISIIIRAPTTTTSSSSGGSSGGGGGGGSSAESYENIAEVAVVSNTVIKDSTIEYDYDSSEEVVSSVSFTALQNLGTVKARVEVLYDQSSFVGEGISDKEVYHYLNIWVDRYGFTDGLHYDNAQVSFAVEKSWIEDNNIDVDSIQLNWYSEVEYQEGWKGLATELVSSDEEYYYFSSEVSEFSCFAITGDVIDESEQKTVSADINENAGSSYQVEAVNSNDIQEETVDVEGGFLSNMFSSVKEFFANIFNQDPIEEAYDDGKFDTIIEE
jgi:PGF-pre-PGF domain-containing protein